MTGAVLRAAFPKLRAANMRSLILTLLCVLPSVAAAVGDEDDFSPPKPTETTEVCENGKVWDRAKETCVQADKSSNDETAIRQDIRELACVGRFNDASVLIAQLDPRDTWGLTYRGFVARKTGDPEGANRFCQAAIYIDPNNLLARSYMAQGFVEEGKISQARYEQRQIWQRGGRGTWPDVALTRALRSGRGLSY